MKLKVLFFFLVVPSLLFAQGIRPNQFRKTTGSNKQKIFLADPQTGEWDYHSDGVILPYTAFRSYDSGDIVTFSGAIWVSDTNGNVSTPGVANWTEIGAGGGGAESIGPNNVILRTPEVGDTIVATTPGGWVEWWSFAPPTLSNVSFAPSATVYEVGTSTAITLSGTTTNPASATLSGGILERITPDVATINSFGAAALYSQGITFTPQQGGSGAYNELLYQFRASQNYSGTESGTVQSNTKTLQAVYPVFYGMGSTDTTAVKADIYGLLNKSVVTENDRSYTFTGSGLIYYAFPASWSDTNLSQILDPNGFDATASFTRTTTTVTSTGLTNNYTAVSYVVYYLNTGSTTTNNSQYTFNQ